MARQRVLPRDVEVYGFEPDPSRPQKGAPGRWQGAQGPSEGAETWLQWQRSVADDRPLIAGAFTYAQAFKKAPPATRAELDRELESLPSDAQNLIVTALWQHPYEAFVAAVRGELMKRV